MNAKKIAKLIRGLTDPIVDKQKLDYASKHNYNYKIRGVAKQLTDMLDKEISPFVSQLRLSYKWNEAPLVLEALSHYKKKGFYISGSETATTEKDGFYELKRKQQ
jgi:hypothetical protein